MKISGAIKSTIKYQMAKTFYKNSTMKSWAPLQSSTNQNQLQALLAKIEFKGISDQQETVFWSRKRILIPNLRNKKP